MVTEQLVRPDQPPGPPQLVVAASYGQERIWLACQTEGDLPLYNLFSIVDLPAALSPAQVGQLLSVLTQRHEPLRTGLELRDEELVQVVWPAWPVTAPPVTDLSDLDAADTEARLLDLYRAETNEPFQLDVPPLWRARLIRLPHGWRLTFAGHHSILDGTSYNVLQDELTELAAAALAGRQARLPELAIQYADFSAWQREQWQAPGPAEQLGYWQERLAGLPAVHGLPTDRPRTSDTRAPGADYLFTLPAGVREAAAGLGRRYGATEFMVGLAAYIGLLARLSGETDLVVGVPVAGRDLPELAGLVGMFVNTVVLRVDVADDPPFGQLVRRVREQLLAAWDHGPPPLQLLVERFAPTRDPAIAPLFQLGFNQLGRTGLGTSFGVARDEILLELSGDDGRVEYRTDLFEEPTIGRLVQGFVRLLRLGTADPDGRLSKLDLLGDQQRATVLTEFNQAEHPVPTGERTLPSLVADQVARTPDAVAVRFREQSLSYAALDAWAARIAARLVARGAGPESLVGICAERCLGLPAALLGALKAGAGYVPIDPDYPQQRREFLAADAGVCTVLTTADIEESWHWPDPPAGADWPAATADNVAYVIYTSGSTGQPKGVANAHRGVVNRLDWMQRAFGLDGSDTVVQKTPYSFDVSVWEFFWPLLAGAQLVLAEPGGHKDPAYLERLFATAGVTTAHFVPSMLAAFVAIGGPGRCPALRRLICSGEELPAELARQAVAAASAGCALHNLYGPTEAAIDVSWWACQGTEEVVPIGRPIQNVQMYILDRHGAPCPIGVAGELYLGGVAVARGYWRRPGLTGQRFVPDPFGPPGSRLYRTGDAARWRSDGAVEFLGRLDDQVKLRGMRIELGEISTALLEQSGVDAATVVLREDSPGDARLVAYLVTPEPVDGTPEPVESAALRTALQARLPDYLVPAAFVRLPALPTTPNGKLDRRALPPPPAPVPAAGGTGSAPPSTPTEQLVAQVWQEVLDPALAGRLGVDDDFFALGGHSLLAVRVVGKLNRRLDGAAPAGGVGVMDLFQHRTLGALARYLDGGAERPSGQLLHQLTPAVPAADDDDPVATFVCVPYGGAPAAVFQPLADALPPAYSLYAVGIPGHDIGRAEAALPFDELAERCTAEVLERVSGPLLLYGHCGIGGALIIELARRLTAAGRHPVAVYVGGVFPFAAPRGPLRFFAPLGRLMGHRRFANWLTGLGVDLRDVDPADADRIVTTMRDDWLTAEAYFTDLLDRRVARLGCPVISVIGTEDPLTEFYQERYREWGFITDTTALVELDDAGHFFLRYRPEETAAILTTTHPALAAPAADRPGADTWRLAEVKRASEPDAELSPTLGRFLAVAIGQTVTLIGSAMTSWAVPLFTYLESNSLSILALLATLAILPWVLAGPVAGAVADRFDRRKVMMAAGAAALSLEVGLGVLLWTGQLALWYLFVLTFGLGVAASFQRLAYQAAIPQLVPKRYLGHAMGAVQLSTGSAVLIVPLVAAGMLATVGLEGILIFDIVTFGFALSVLAVVRFPALLGTVRKEPFRTELVEGARYTWRHHGLRRMILLTTVLNVFFAPALLFIPPIVLRFGDLLDVGQVSFIEGIGAFGGSILMMIWGGPRVFRMRGTLTVVVCMGLLMLLIGVSPSFVTVAIGGLGLAATVSMVQALHATIIQVKAPQRFHGRVLSLYASVTWGALPVGWLIGAVVADWIGLGPLFIVGGLVLLVLTLAALRHPGFWRFDQEVPDSLPDDLFAAQKPRTGSRLAAATR